MQAWDVYLAGEWIDTVYFLPTMGEGEVIQSLVKHDGFSPDIVVVKVDCAKVWQ